METRRIGWQLVLAGMLGILAAGLHAQESDAAAWQVPSGTRLSQPQLEQLLAPIALYPDDLIVQVAEAATHPLQIVEADRWLKSTSGQSLASQGLATALRDQPWDASVKALTTIPNLLEMMDNNLAWTEALGRAFRSQRPALMDAIQALRRRADAAGNLRSTPQQQVVSDGQDISIYPAQPDEIAVPYYDPSQVYADWPWDAYPPDTLLWSDYQGFWGPQIAFVTVIVVGHPWHHHRCDWQRHRIDPVASAATAVAPAPSGISAATATGASRAAAQPAVGTAGAPHWATLQPTTSRDEWRHHPVEPQQQPSSRRAIPPERGERPTVRAPPPPPPAAVARMATPAIARAPRLERETAWAARPAEARVYVAPAAPRGNWAPAAPAVSHWRR